MKDDVSKSRIEEIGDALKGKDRITNYELEHMADYILMCGDAGSTLDERLEEFPIETKNRTVTIDKRQTSLDAISDSPIPIQQLTADPRRQQPLVRKDKVDVKSNPKLASRYDVIESLRRQEDAADGLKLAALRQQETDEWKLIYEMNASTHHPMSQPRFRQVARMDLGGTEWMDEELMPHSTSPINLLDENCVHFLLQNYYNLKSEVGDDTTSDMYFLLLDLEDLVARVFPKASELRTIMALKMEGASNSEVNEGIMDMWGKHHTRQYYSSVWCNRIPQLLVRQAQKDAVFRYWRNPDNKMTWKRCSKCGRLMPAHQLFFRRNGKGKWYSTCKECYNKGGK